MIYCSDLKKSGVNLFNTLKVNCSHPLLPDYLRAAQPCKECSVDFI